MSSWVVCLSNSNVLTDATLIMVVQAGRHTGIGTMRHGPVKSSDNFIITFTAVVQSHPIAAYTASRHIST